MSTSPNHKNCLQLGEIELYVKGQLSSAQVHALENHILDCELCHDAIEGYREQAFSAEDIPSFNSLAKPPQPRVQITRWISIAAVVLIGTTAGLIYTENTNNSFRDEMAVSDQTVLLDSTYSVIAQHKENNADKNLRLNDLIEKDKEVKELVTKPIQESNDLSAFGKKDPSVWMMPQKNLQEISGLTSPGRDAGFRSIDHDTFIYDLKINSYQELYAVSNKSEPEKSSATEARFEQKNQLKTEGKEEDLEKLTTEDVLIKAMENFSKNNFTNALKLFNILISYEPEDVNSLFYASLCYKNLNRSEDALVYLDRLLSNSNTAFKEEAEWEKAQVYVQLKDFKKAEILLENILKSKGFYADRANELLKRVKVKNKSAADPK